MNSIEESAVGVIERQGNQPMMLVSRDRIAYWGGWGRPTMRTLGAWTFYLACDSPFELHIDGQETTRDTFALVAPWVAHRVVTNDRNLAHLLIEAESVDGAAFTSELMGTGMQRSRTEASIRHGFSLPPCSADAFDDQFFGKALPYRVLDARIRAVAQLFDGGNAINLSARECASMAGLSFFRFMHLFTAEMHVPFRRYRAWKRARRLLNMMGGHSNLLAIALDAGYADPTHLCRSVRKCYGYTPSAMFDGSRRVLVIPQWST